MKAAQHVRRTTHDIEMQERLRAQRGNPRIISTYRVEVVSILLLRPAHNVEHTVENSSPATVPRLTHRRDSRPVALFTVVALGRLAARWDFSACWGKWMGVACGQEKSASGTCAEQRGACAHEKSNFQPSGEKARKRGPGVSKSGD